MPLHLSQQRSSGSRPASLLQIQQEICKVSDPVTTVYASRRNAVWSSRPASTRAGYLQSMPGRISSPAEGALDSASIAGKLAPDSCASGLDGSMASILLLCSWKAGVIQLPPEVVMPAATHIRYCGLTAGVSFFEYQVLCANHASA